MVTIIDHPLACHWLARLRDVECPRWEFRELIRKVSGLLFLEASRGLELTPVSIKTPLASTDAQRLKDPPVLAPILRAGLGMADGILDWAPEALVRHVGLYRDHQTLEPVTYYEPTSAGVSGSCVFVLDPMLATGGSAVAALSLVKSWGIVGCKLLCIIGAP